MILARDYKSQLEAEERAKIRKKKTSLSILDSLPEENSE